MMNAQTQKLLNRFKSYTIFSNHHAILIGGTALAYHLSHRESFDLNICFPFANKLPELDFFADYRGKNKVSTNRSKDKYDLIELEKLEANNK